MAEGKENGPEDSVTTEMIKELPQEKIFERTKHFRNRFVGQEDAPSSWRSVRFVYMRKPGAEHQKGDRKLQGDRTRVGDVEVVRDLRGTLAGKRKRAWRMEAAARGRSRWHQLSAFPRDDCADTAQTLGVAGRQEDVWRGRGILRKKSEWITAAPIRELEDVVAQATIENVEKKFQFTRCIRQGSVEAPTLWLKRAHALVSGIVLSNRGWKTDMDGDPS